MSFNPFARARSAEAKFSTITDAMARLSEQFEELAHTVETASARPRGLEMLRKLGVTPERFVERHFENKPDNALYEALYGGSESLRGEPSAIGLPSSLCRQIHFSTDEFRYWMQAMGRAPRMHRKDWEWFYIAQVLFERGMLQSGKRGLGFAVGQEPLPSLFASWGCDVVATDQAPEQAAESGWAEWGMHSATLESIYHAHICPREQFDRHVAYENADMNAIPVHFECKFDFCWSSCAFEHLGSLEHGLKFVERSLDTLVPGGIAVHTTEFNLSSNDNTIESPGNSIYRRRDMEALVDRLEAAGHHALPFDWSTGHGFAETVIDLPPYRQSPHLKLKIAEYDCTSIGIIVQRGPVAS